MRRLRSGRWKLIYSHGFAPQLFDLAQDPNERHDLAPDPAHAATLERLTARVLDGWEPPASTIYAVYPGNRLMSMKVRAFVDHLVRCFGRTHYWDNGL